MAMKIKSDMVAAEVSETTSMIGFPADGSLVAASPVVEEDLMPQLKIVYPIEVGPDKPFKLTDCYQVGVFSGKAFEKLPEGYKLTVIASRDMCKRISKNEDDETVYIRSYRPFAGIPSASAAQFEMDHTEKDQNIVQQGTAYILGVIMPDGKAAVVELQACKSSRKYWGIALSQAVFTNKLGLRIKIMDHTENLESGGKGNYLSSKKFKQWEIVELTDADFAALAPVYKENVSKIESWIKR